MSFKPEIQKTADNYQSRSERFKKWAETDSGNLSASEKAREVFMMAVRESKLDALPIVDAGCGSGRDMLEFARNLDNKVLGFDVCENFVGHCHARNLSVTLDDFESFFAKQEDCSFAGVFCLASIFHVPRPDLRVKFHRKRLLKL